MGNLRQPQIQGVDHEHTYSPVATDTAIKLY